MSFNIDGTQIYNSFISASEKLQLEKDRLNSLNVFPVADRDTGINMALTMKKTTDNLSCDGTPAQLFENAYKNLLEYSHGNSGTILALFFEGVKEKIPQIETITGADLALAFVNGAKNAYYGVLDPMPGTILTVAQQSAYSGVSMLEITEDAGKIMKRISDEAHAALMQTPFQNPVLEPYNIVDSGALGFCLIMDGFLSAIAPELKSIPYPALRLPGTVDSNAKKLIFRYCTEFVMNMRNDKTLDDLRQEIQVLGEYFVLISNESLCKVHIHTDTPEKVLSLASAYGTIKSSKIDDMLQQI